MRFNVNVVMKAVTACAAGGAIAFCGIRMAHGHRQEAPAMLPTGKAIQPLGAQTQVGSFPVNMAISPDGKWLVVTNSGDREFLSVLKAADGSLVSQQEFNTSPGGGRRNKKGLYVGLTFAPTAGQPTVYASCGRDAKVVAYQIDPDGKLIPVERTLDFPPEPSSDPKRPKPDIIAHIAFNSDGSRLYAVNNQTSLATGLKGSVSILDTASDKVLGKIETPGYPYALAAMTKGPEADKKLYVSSERDGVVSVLDVRDPAKGRIVRDIRVGMQPIALLLDAAQKRLFVANAGSDTVSVVDTASDRVVSTLSLRLDTLPNLPGVTPTGLALSPDESRLYVTLADLNAVGVIAVKGKSLTLAGAIPVGWYPTSVVVSKDGAQLYVANAKGVQANNPNKEAAGPNHAWGHYIETILEGTVAGIAVPHDSDLKNMTTLVKSLNAPLTATRRTLPSIKHVIYIIKENRTYDQVLGDLPQGNGDPTLTLFGREVTPNLHALAERFVLLDNFYDCAEVSADGWNWSTSGMASEYDERNVRINYSGRGRTYDYEGENNGTPVDLIGMPDVNRAPGGYIWDLCAKQGVSYRNYGFFVTGGNSVTLDGKPLAQDNMPAKKALVGHTDTDFRQFDMAYADSDAWKRYNCPAQRQKQTYGKNASSCRFEEWKREFDGYVKDGKLPAFSMVRFPRDHTEGTAQGLSTPKAMVADNDYAVGQLVEAVSHSRYWKDTAIFVLEDDAQNGDDHVDAHRSICFVISPYIKKGTVDHAFYNTDSVLHTMEMLLGLPAMCQYDALAPVLDAFGESADNAEPYTAVLPSKAVISQMNEDDAYQRKLSDKLDFLAADRVPDPILNDIIWHSVKGKSVPEPPARHTLGQPQGAQGVSAPAREDD